MAEKVSLAVLVERVNNHIIFFWAIVGVFAVAAGILFTQLSNLKGDVGAIKGSLRIASTTSALQSAALAADATAPQALESARQAIDTAKKESIHIQPDLPLRVASRAIQFAMGQNDPSIKNAAWLTVQDTVNYASSEIVSEDLLKRGFSNCIEGNGPKGGAGGLFDITTSKDGKTLSVKGKTELKNCVLDLDQTSSKSVFAFVLPVVFENCIVRYSGGRTSLTGKLIFKNCLFVMNLNETPVPQGQTFTETLAASGMMQADIPPA